MGKIDGKQYKSNRFEDRKDAVEHVTYHGASPEAFERKSQGYQTTDKEKREEMLVNDRKEIRYQAMPPQWLALRVQIKQFCVVGAVSVPLNLSLSSLEEDGFLKYSELGNTHNPNTQGGLNPCMCM
jgi:hypothetical protein